MSASDREAASGGGFGLLLLAGMVLVIIGLVPLVRSALAPTEPPAVVGDPPADPPVWPPPPDRAFVGPGRGRLDGQPTIPAPPTQGDVSWRRMVASEDLLDALTLEVMQMGRSVSNLRLPDERTRSQFADPVVLVDLPDAGGASTEVSSVGTSVLELEVRDEPRRVERAELDLWRRMFDRVDFFHHVEIGIAFGALVGDDPDRFAGQIKFDGLASTLSGARVAFHAAQDVRWRRKPGSEGRAATDWEIVEWRVTHWRETAGPERSLFREVLDEVISDPQQLAQARESTHERLVARMLSGDPSFQRPHQYFAPVSLDQTPGLLVTDIDADGFDDLYVIARWTRNRLYCNRGDGTFEECAERYGLDVAGGSSCGLFADFDNDGDADLMLGRTFHPSLYLVNEDGVYRDASAELIGPTMPYLVSSVSAADYDGDGLLDLYLTTFAAGVLKDVSVMSGGDWQRAMAAMSTYLPAADNQAMFERLARIDSDAYLSFHGPPNLLYHNAGGGRFTRVQDPGDLAAFRNTHVASWSDYDQDGDPDVYLANDFAADMLIRNDGDGNFTEIAESMGIVQHGFGMGVSWGDYDQDGLQDLYVTNMMSKAGQRITGHLPQLDPRHRESAMGNYLYRNAVDRFQKVSGSEPDDLLVESVGWSWGSMFVDLDNDGWLDIYAPTGYYTAPLEVRRDGDM